MAQNVNLADDLKTAAVLAGAAGLLGALSVPFLLPLSFQFVPPEQRTLPLPLPLFCGLLVIQFLVVYGLDCPGWTATSAPAESGAGPAAQRHLDQEACGALRSADRHCVRDGPSLRDGSGRRYGTD
jgi:hypothetical protein